MSAAPGARPVHWLVPGPLDQITGGYRYDRLMVEGLRSLGVSVTVHELPGCHPVPDAAAVEGVRAALAAIPDGSRVVVDGLALPALALGDGLGGRELRAVALVHHPVSLETGLDAEEAAGLGRLERDWLPRMGRVVATSPYTAEVLRGFGVPADRLGVVEPGTDRAPHPARGSGGGRAELLCIATLTPRKGHAVLVEALAGLTDLDWHLSCVGSLTRDPALVEGLRAAIGAQGLAGRVTLAGERKPADLAEFYDRADVFVLPSFYEGYGMAFAEALSWGLPVIGTTAGAIPWTVPAGAGLLVPPGDAAALAAALRRVLTENALRRDLVACARRAAEGLPGWDRQIARFRAELERAG